MGQQIMNNDPKRKDRDFRFVSNFEVRAAPVEPDGDEVNPSQELYVEGYAVVFNDPTVLWEYDGIQYKEQVDRDAFSETDMSDVIFNYNHGGKVMARTRNNTLTLTVDDKGLKVRARLDGTEEGRDLYEEIQGGYIDRMSFSFTTKESSYDSDNHMRTILKVKKLYDVSAVDIPAYDTTSISARSFFELEREKERKALESVELRKKLALRASIAQLIKQ
jgi:HK97 family phage prohead protease